MITLYELHWSHYCEKIRWALDYKKLAWEKIGINAFNKKEVQHFFCGKLVPLIYDKQTQIALNDSTPILNYLEKTYPDSPTLFPNQHKEDIQKYLLELDSKLGIVARRLGYTQLILEKPVILAHLFLKDVFKGIFTWPGMRQFSSAVLGMLLIKRFELEKNESLNLYENLENYLLLLTEKIKKNRYIIGNLFTAVDLTLAVYLRPLCIVPFFKEHPGLQLLFHWQKKLLEEHCREPVLLYEILIAKHRQKHSPVRRKIKMQIQDCSFLENIIQEVKKTQQAFNDQKKIWEWGILRIPYYYFYKIMENKLQQRFASKNAR